MLNIAFLFHSYKQNDGKQRLLIRMRTRDQEKKISTDIYIDKRNGTIPTRWSVQIILHTSL